MQFNKTLKTLLRAKQEGQNDSYKAGFNDALALLDQEEEHIEFEKYVKRHIHSEEDIPKNAREYQHKEVDHLEGKMDEIAQETVSELAAFKEDAKSTPSTDFVAPPKIQIEPESISLDEEIGDRPKSSKEAGSGVVLTEFGKDLMGGQHTSDDKDTDKPIPEEAEETIRDDKHDDVGKDEQLDDDEAKRQRQLAAIANARRKAKEAEGDDE